MTFFFGEGPICLTALLRLLRARTSIPRARSASALLEPTLDQSVSAFAGGAYTAKSSQESHYGRSEQTWHRIRPRTLGRWLMLPEADPRTAGGRARAAVLHEWRVVYHR